MNEAGQQSIRRVFEKGFALRDIAEPLVSFDEMTDADVARQLMDERGFDVAGVRRGGLVDGTVKRDDLGGGRCGDHRQPIDAGELLSDSTPLAEVVKGLTERPRLLVRSLGAVGGIATKEDLEKPPVRMWLFGMVTLIEMRFSRLIEQHCPDDSWRESISEARLAKAAQLRQERSRRGQQVSLLDCVQFGDKGQIMARTPALREATRLESRRAIEKVFKELERLRNNLAHSQEIVTSDWSIIVQLTENLDRVIEGPPGLRRE